MGQAQASSTWETYEPNYDITPGTYRIVHDGSDKVLQIHEENHKMLVIGNCQGQGSDDDHVQNDHWFILRSGDAFIFKHCQLESYISGLLQLSVHTYTSDRPICATRYPTTWAIHRKKGSNDIKCAITIPIDWEEFRSRSGYIGIGANSTGVRLCFVPLSEKEELDQMWRFERIGDATLEEDYAYKVHELGRQLQATNGQCASRESELTAMQQQLNAKEAELENMQCELNKQTIELKAVQNESSKQVVQLKEQHKVLDGIRILLDAKERVGSKKDKETSENREILREKVQEVSQGGRLQNLETIKDKTVEVEGAEGEVAEEEGVEDESVLDEQVPRSTLTTQEPRRKATNSAPLSNSTMQQPAPEPAPTPEIVIHTFQPPPSASVEQRLAEMGFFHFG